MGLLIDSTLLVRAERNRQSPGEFVAEIIEVWGDVELAVSTMSAGELLHGCRRADTPARRASRAEFVEALFSALPVVAITLPIMRIFAEIDARLRASGNRLPTSDLLIACTALSRRDDLVTGNLRHFDRVPGLTVHAWA
ncbi:MAG: PIN domain-containing protein [Longimicrobiales bacterium]